MSLINGRIVAGEFDKEVNEFLVHKVKNLSTSSALTKKQALKLYNYLKSHENDPGGQVITLYDQMLLSLSREELNSLICDLEEIQDLYH
ncbi:hypothetical protein [Halalkalibacter krulwichiae]|uniref:Uncharacterized protein n=1 Tax=Halalkalibacter krulwichiae TaxID=199441 RepID=A0A1X9MDC3_9BACI|nr:hypothetical protein [Halalkalibacter krulwichiae]ARK30550.1 hypothetical protein BkAM31D_12310 [Halalkalibacter krulwichiae]